MDDSQAVKYVYVDSTNRDTDIYPSANSYTLHLTNPLHSVVQVDLVNAKVPNTMYNLTNGSNALIWTNTSNVLAPATSNISIAPGFYSTWGLAQALTAAGGYLFCVEYLEFEGKYLFSSNVSSYTVQATTSEMQTMLGMTAGAKSSFLYSSDPIYNQNLNYIGRSLYKTSKISNMSLNESVFLDIDEFRTTSVIDAKKMVGPTTDGQSIRSTFGMIPMDVASGQIKNFKESGDYKQFIQFDSPIPKVSRLTIRWTDARGQLLNFQDFNLNSFTLRIHCQYPKEPVPPPPPPVTMVELRRILDDMITVQKPKEVARPLVGRWTLAILFLILVAGYLIYKATRPVVAALQPPQLRPVGPGAYARVTA